MTDDKCQHPDLGVLAGAHKCRHCGRVIVLAPGGQILYEDVPPGESPFVEIAKEPVP